MLLLKPSGMGDKQMAPDIYGIRSQQVEIAARMAMAQSRSHSEPPNWLPRQKTNQPLYTSIINPYTNEPFAVPALVLSDAGLHHAASYR